MSRPDPTATHRRFLTLRLGTGWFAIAVDEIRDVVNPLPFTPVPLAPAEIVGLINLRGRIVTALDLRRRLDVVAEYPATEAMGIVIGREGGDYCLLVDGVGDVAIADDPRMEPVPGTVNPRWREAATGLLRLSGALVPVLDVGRVLKPAPLRDVA